MDLGLPSGLKWATTTGVMGTRCAGCTSEISHNERILRDYRGVQPHPLFFDDTSGFCVLDL